jgi:HSP20 family molecular chaperone IbpA
VAPALDVVPAKTKSTAAERHFPGPHVYLGMPGVDRKDIDLKVEEDTLSVEARIDTSKYEGMEPLYTEYNVGHFARRFALSHAIDRQQIGATLSDGVLSLTLKKVQQAKPRRIEIG